MYLLARLLYVSAVAVRHGRVPGIPTSDSEGLGFASQPGRGHT
jgi:hypothetical protein